MRGFFGNLGEIEMAFEKKICDTPHEILTILNIVIPESCLEKRSLIFFLNIKNLNANRS